MLAMRLLALLALITCVAGVKNYGPNHGVLAADMLEGNKVIAHMLSEFAGTSKFKTFAPVEE
jgi:hypothetical protein